MTYIKRTTVAVTTAADGTATAYSEELNGLLSTIHYDKTDFPDTVDFTITEEDTGLSIWAESNLTASTVRAPRMLTHSAAGVASAAAEGLIPIRGRIKIVITQGGNAKLGSFTITTH
jgi:hypothetical protein